MGTTTTNTTSNKAAAGWPRTARRLGVVTGAVLIGCAGLGAVGAASSAAKQTTGLRICTWRPVADETGGSPDGLLGTVRVADGGIEVLHRVSCSDGSFRDAWMAAID